MDTYEDLEFKLPQTFNTSTILSKYRRPSSFICYEYTCV